MIPRITGLAVLFVGYVLGSVQGMIVHGRWLDTTIAVAIMAILAVFYGWRLGAT